MKALVLVAFLLASCVPYTGELRQLDKDYRDGRIGYREYRARRSTFEVAQQQWQADAHARAVVFAQSMQNASQQFSAAQQRQSEQSMYYNDRAMQRLHDANQRAADRAYRPIPPSYHMRPDGFGGYQISPY